MTLHRSAIRTRVDEGLGNVLERGGHFVGGLEEELPRIVAEPLRIAERLPGADAQQNIVRVRVALAQVMHVVGADERQVQVPRNRRQAAVDQPLLLDAVPLHLEKEVVRSEDVPVGAGGFDRLLFLLARQAFGHFAFQALLKPISPFACRARNSLSIRGL